MSSPLRVGVAGLGTVGAAVLQVLARRGESLAARAGQPIQVVAVSARNKSKARDVGAASWHDDPVALARSPDIDCFVELIGGESGPALDAVRAALTLSPQQRRTKGDAARATVRRQFADEHVFALVQDRLAQVRPDLVPQPSDTPPTRSIIADDAEITTEKRKPLWG